MALDLITLAEYKAYAGLNSDTQDATITSLIPKVSALVKSLCRRTFVDYLDEFKTDVSRGGVNGLILLEETPLVQVSSVEFSEDYGKSYITLVEYDDYVIDTRNSEIELIAPKYIEYFRAAAFKVTYAAGYEELPVDLKLAIYDLVTYYIRNDAAIHAKKAIGANTVQIEYITNTSLPAHIRRVLDLHTAYYS